jgi:beta-glucanase (GH16 family)
MCIFPLSVALALSTACSDSAPETQLTGPATKNLTTDSAAHDSLSRPVGPLGRWQLVFSDEFSGSGVDSSKWHTTYWWGGWKGEEQQEYVPSGVTLSGGAAHLTARPRPGHKYPYTSGMLATWGRFNLSRGTVVEARVKTPAGVGLWPAVWLHTVSGHWPPEIDILETRGFEPSTWLLSAHWADATGAHQSKGFRPKDDSYAEGYHTVTMQWDSTQIAWYIDGEQKGLITDPAKIPNEPMYLILNLAIGGGGWPGKPDATTPFPASFDIDYVRVWTPAP